MLLLKKGNTEICTKPPKLDIWGALMDYNLELTWQKQNKQPSKAEFWILQEVWKYVPVEELWEGVPKRMAAEMYAREYESIIEDIGFI